MNSWIHPQTNILARNTTNYKHKLNSTPTSQTPTKSRKSYTLLHITTNIKFQYLASASAFLILALAGPIKVPPQRVSNFQLSCDGTSGAECNEAKKPKPTVNGTEAHYWLPHPHHHGSATTTATFTRPTENLPPKTITISPGTTPEAGSFIWKRVRESVRRISK